MTTNFIDKESEPNTNPKFWEILGSFPSLNQTSLIKAPRVSSVAGEYNDDARKQRREASLKCVLAMRLVNARILQV